MAILQTLTVNGVTYKVATPVPVVNITLLASAWVASDNRYSQVVPVPGVTSKSRVNLTPSVGQVEIFYEKNITFVTENDGGKVTVYVIGQKPENDYTIPVDIMEVVTDSSKIYGYLVTTPLNPDKIAAKDVVKSVNGAGPDENGNVEVATNGVYIGSDTPPENANVWINPNGDPTSTEDWKFTLEDGTTETKTVIVVD